MASNNQKTELLFKEFNNVVNARQEVSFSTTSQNKFPFRNYVLNESIFSNTIPKNLSDISYNLDSTTTVYGANALDSSFNNSGQVLGISYEIPNTDLVFYYRAELQPALTTTSRTWYIDDNLGNNDSLIKDTIPFLYDATYLSYTQTLYDSTGNLAYSLYEYPLYWLLDNQSGFVQFYGDEEEINLDVANNGPYRFSFIKYNGPKGASGGGGGGGGDASFNNIDISGDIILQDNNLMQSLTIQPWVVPTPTSPNLDTYYIIATVPESGANAFGYFTIQLQEVYLQQVSFYAGVMENKNSVIKVISNTNQNIVPGSNIGFKNLQIILYSNVYYLVTIFQRGSGNESSLLKIILTNNNSNGQDLTNTERYWTLRNDSAADWSSLGPQPPHTKAPWTLDPLYQNQPDLPPAQVTISLANTNAIFGGNPHGMSTQPEFFQSDIVMGPNGNIVATNGTGTIDICGNLYVDRDASFNQDVFIRDSLDISNNVNIGGNLTVNNLATFTGIENSNNEIKTNTLFVAANNSSNGNNMTTEVIPRIGPNVVSDSFNHGGNTFEYYKLASINTIVDSSLNYFACNGFFELNYYYTGGNFNGAGKSATMQMIRFMVGGTSRKESGTTYTDNLYIKILSNQYQGPNTTDYKFKDLVLITDVSNQLILYSKIWKPQPTPSARYSIRIYQDTNDVNAIHNPNTSWKLYELNDAYVGPSIPTSPTIINRYEIDLSLQALDLSSPIDGMDMKYIDTCGNDLKNSNVINTQPEFFQQYTKFNKGIDINNTKIINNRGLLGKDQSVIGNNVGASPNTDDMYIESLGVASDIYIKVQPEHNIKFVGRDSTTGTESTNPIDINPLNSGIIDMDFNGTNNIKGVNNIEAAYYGDISANNINANDITANDITANDISANKIYVDNLESRTTNKIIIGDDINLTLNDISNVDALNVNKIYQNSGSDQIILGNLINPQTKYIRFDNKLGLYTATSLTNAVSELNGSNPQNYLIGYRDNDISGGLIYRADIASGTMNKLVTTTSLHRFSTNFFRTLDPQIGGKQTAQRRRQIEFTSSIQNPIYKTFLYNTDQLILNPGIENWYPTSATYDGTSSTQPTGNIFTMKQLQLSKNQYVRVINFTFEGYNNNYRFNAAFMGAGGSPPIINKVYFQIVFGFGNNRAFEMGPWTTSGQENFQKCYEINTSTILAGGSSSNTLIVPDLSLNTYYTATNPTYKQIPIEKKAIPTFFDTGSFQYYNLAPMIFIRAMDETDNTPWTYDKLIASGLTGTSFYWDLIVTSTTTSGLQKPDSDLPWTVPFGAQFLLEHYIPANDT